MHCTSLPRTRAAGFFLRHAALTACRDASFALASIYAQLGKLKRAAVVLDHQCKLKPTADTLNALGAVYRELGKAAAATALFEVAARGVVHSSWGSKRWRSNRRTQRR